MPRPQASASTADHPQGDPALITAIQLDPMAGLPKTRHNHGLRFSPIQADLQNLPGCHGLQRELAANEIDRTGSTAKIKPLCRAGLGHRQP